MSSSLEKPMNSDTKFPPVPYAVPTIGADDPMYGGGGLSADERRGFLKDVEGGKAVWLHDLMQRAQAKGVDWTPEEAARARGILSKRGVEIYDDVNDPDMFEARMEGAGVEKTAVDRVIDKFAESATMGAFVPSGQYEAEGLKVPLPLLPDLDVGRALDVGGSVAGMSIPVGGIARALSKAGQLAHPLAFGAYEAGMAEGGFKDRGKAGLHGLGLGLGLAAAPTGAVTLASRLGGAAKGAGLAKALASPVGQTATAGATLAGLEAAHGGDPMAGGVGGMLASMLTRGLVPRVRAPEVTAEAVATEAPRRPLSKLVEAEARFEPEPTQRNAIIDAKRDAVDVVMEMPMGERVAPGRRDLPKEFDAKLAEANKLMSEIDPTFEPVTIERLPKTKAEALERGKTLSERIAELKVEKAEDAEYEFRKNAREQEDLAARDEALSPGALAPDAAREQRMAKSLAGRQRQKKMDDISHVMPSERLTRRKTDNQLYEATLNHDAMKEMMASGPTFEEIMAGRKRVLSKLRALDESTNNDVTLGSGLGGITGRDYAAVRDGAKARAKARARDIALKATGGDLQFAPKRAATGNALDLGSVRYSRSTNIADFAEAIKRGMPVTADFTEGLKDITDFSGKGEYLASGRTGLLQKASGGRLGGSTEKHILWPLRALDDARIVWSHQQKAKISDWMDKHGVRRGRKRAKEISDMMEDPAMRGEPVVVELREIFDNMRKEVNTVRVAMGKKPIKYREDYIPHIEHVNRLAEMFKDGAAQHGETPDFIRNPSASNPRALQRYGRTKNPERDIVKLLDNYINVSTRDIFNSAAITHLRNHSRVMRKEGLSGAAAGVEKMTDVLYSGRPPSIAGVGNAFAHRVPGLGAVRKGVHGVKARLNKAVFTMNPVWSAFVQPLSTALTYMRTGEVNYAKGRKLALNPNFRAWADQHIYSIRMKGRKYGSVRRQETGDADATLSTDLMSRTKIGAKAANAAEYMTVAIERDLSMHAAASHWHLGKSRGLRGRELIEFVSDGVAKTQSMYNFADMPGLLQERDLTSTILPFSTYAFELMNQVREMNIPVLRKVTGRTGHYERVRAGSPEGQAIIDSRFKRIARWTAAVVAQQAYLDAMGVNKDITNPGTGIPFYSFLMDFGRGGHVLPKQVVSEFTSAVGKVIEYGDFKPLRKFMMRYFVAGGVQMNRMLTGAEAVAAGGEFDVRGRKKFDVKEDEAFRAMFFGPYGTEGGREYIEKLNGKKKPAPVTRGSSRGRRQRGGR